MVVPQLQCLYHLVQQSMCMCVVRERLMMVVSMVLVQEGLFFIIILILVFLVEVEGEEPRMHAHRLQIVQPDLS